MSHKKTTTCAQWDVIDLTFETSEAPADPFAVQLGAVFHGPNHAELTLPGFYNGGRTFVVRFSPPTVGTWTYETTSSLPALAGQRGTVQAVPQEDTQRHGPLVISPEHPQRFAYADGTPYYLLAFECDWLFALDLGNQDGIPKTETLLDQIVAHGLNHVVMNVFAYDISWDKDPSVKPEHDFSAPAVTPFGGTNDDPDFSVLNVDFFKHLDRVIRALDARGIIAHLMIYVWNKCVNWPEMVSEADNRYFDTVIARYQAFPNVVWDISKEALTYGRCDIAYVNERIRRLRRLDAYRRLLTVHDYHYCSRHPENVDFISIQTWTSGLYHTMLGVREKYPHKPIFNIEHGGYEKSPYVIFPGDYVEPQTCLERNYECIFAGAYSTYYWQATSWSVVIPDPLGLPEAQRPSFDYYRHLADLFTRYDFTTLDPMERGSSSGLRLTNGEGLIMILIPKENYAIHVHLPESTAAPWQVTSFNPFTGEYRGQEPVSLNHWHEFKSPWPGQMTILILEQ